MFQFLSLLFFFLLWVSIAYHVLNYTKKRAKTRTAAVKRTAKD